MRIAILSTLPDFDDALSIKRVVVDQVKMFQAAGHEPTLYVKQGFLPTHGTMSCISSVQLPGHMVREKEKPETRHEICRRDFVQRFGRGELERYDAILTHDLYFLDTHQGYRSGIREICASSDLVGPKIRGKWFHWSHSTPRPPAGDPTWVSGHTYIALNTEDIKPVAAMYKAPLDAVEVCHNPADVSDVVSDASGSVVQEFDLLNADFLGVLPFPIGRLDQKGVHRAVDYYAAIARRGFRVKVVLCASRCGDRMKLLSDWEAAFEAKTKGTTCQVIWMPRARPQWVDTTPNRVVRELMALSNLFIWPTIGEACSLAIAEARASGGPFCVLPESRVSGMREMVDEDGCLVYWQDGFWRDRKFRQADDVAAEILRQDLERFIRRLRRQWEWSRGGIWARQLRPLLERRCPGAW